MGAAHRLLRLTTLWLTASFVTPILRGGRAQVTAERRKWKRFGEAAKEQVRASAGSRLRRAARPPAARDAARGPKPAVTGARRAELGGGALEEVI